MDFRTAKNKTISIIIGAVVVVIIVLFASLSIVGANNSTNAAERTSVPDDEAKNTATGSIADDESPDDALSLPYYDKSRKDRYAEYAEKNKELPLSEVIWMVDADLDLVEYENYTNILNPSDPMVLVNKYNKLSSNFEPSDLVKIDVAMLKKEPAEALKELKKDAEKQDLSIIANSGYRSYETQNYLYNSYKKDDPENADTYSARPGFSEHQTGYAIDLKTYHNDEYTFVGTPEAAWVNQNAWKYGFIVRYTEQNSSITKYMDEPWHLRYIGAEHAKNMHDLGISSYEEYYVKYIKYSQSANQ